LDTKEIVQVGEKLEAKEEKDWEET